MVNHRGGKHKIGELQQVIGEWRMKALKNINRKLLIDMLNNIS